MQYTMSQGRRAWTASEIQGAIDLVNADIEDLALKAPGRTLAERADHAYLLTTRTYYRALRAFGIELDPVHEMVLARQMALPMELCMELLPTRHQNGARLLLAEF